MPYNLLVLPLLAGYLFIQVSYTWRFRSPALDGYRLLLHSSALGLFFLACARLLVLLVNSLPVGLSIAEHWHCFFPVPYAGTFTLSLLVGLTIAIISNLPNREHWKRAFWNGWLNILLVRQLKKLRIWRPYERKRLTGWCCFWKPETLWHYQRVFGARKTVALRAATKRQGSQLHIFLNDAVVLERMVSVTMSNRKFYIGYVKTSPTLHPDDTHFQLFPLRSGYRRSESLTWEFTADYSALQTARNTDPASVILKLGDVQVANFFDPEEHARFARTTVNANAGSSRRVSFVPQRHRRTHSSRS